MNGSNGRKARQFWNGTGFYIALFLLVTAIAVAGYWTLLPSRSTPIASDEPPADPVETPAEPRAEVTAPASGAALIPKSDPPVIPEPEPQPEPEPALAPVPEEVPFPVSAPAEAQPAAEPVAPRLIVSPLVGETLAAFSVEALQYDRTLDDWRTHDGIDIAAAAGTHVLAACSGTVESVRQSDLLGTTVILSHTGGYCTTYANLQQIPNVAVGEYVSAGQVIGAVGTTALSESALPAHLHFSVTLDGAPVDPQAFLSGA